MSWTTAQPYTPARASDAVGFFSLLHFAPLPTALAVMFSVLSAALSIAPYGFIYLISDELFKPQTDIKAIWLYTGAATALLILRWLFMAISHMFAHVSAFAILQALRLLLARKLGEVPLSFFASRGSGSLRRTLNDDIASLEGFYAHILPDVVSAAIVPLCALILLFFADWRLSLAVLLPLPLAYLAQWWMTRDIAGKVHEWGVFQKTIANQVTEFIRGIQVIKSFGLDARSFGELAKAIHNAVDWIGNFTKQTTGAWIIFTTLLRGNIILVAPLGAIFYVEGSLDLPTYILFLLVSPLVLEPLLRLMFARHEQMHHIEALARINDVLTARTIADNCSIKPPPAPYAITFHNVCHRYGERMAVNQATFIANAGETTVLVGSSGSGKSTLVKLVARLYEFETGSINVGDVNIRDWPLNDLIASTAIVFQDVTLLHGSIADNLRIAKPDASDMDIETACKNANAHDFIMALPQGYQTMLGEQGANLSGGEKQRLSIARALLKNSPILLLDEPTASLDFENEVQIQQAIRSLSRNRTVLMAGHRLSTMTYADKIIVMEKGKVISQGKHDSLLQQCPVYQKLWKDQEFANDWSINPLHDTNNLRKGIVS